MPISPPRNLVVLLARQALAIDERRTAFLPAPWRYEPDAESRDVEQRWFAGCHSDVGGRSGGLAFAWMVREAKAAGLVFDREVPEPIEPQVRHESLSKGYRIFVGAARRPIMEPTRDRKGRRFLNETIAPTAERLVDVRKGARVDVPLDQRPNFRNRENVSGPELSWGLFVGYYAAEYEGLD